MKKTLLLSLFLIGCNNQPVSFKEVEKEPSAPVVSYLCQDFNALNKGEKTLCICPPEALLDFTNNICIFKNDLAQLNVLVENLESIDRNVYKNALLEIKADSINPNWTASLTTKIRGRGNSTWDFPKKPFKMKLDSSTSLMGMPKDKEWVLLANYSDKTLMRVLLANEMGKRLGMSYTPRYKSVELTVNNIYRGVYLLTEQVKVSSSRVNVKDSDITGGYLIELDQYRDGDFVFETNEGIPFVVKEPEDLTLDQQDYISSYFQEVENVLNSSNFNHPIYGYESLIDVNSFIDWYLINEILKNSDAANYSSIYYHKRSGEKLAMGPIWDFDTSSGNNNYTAAQFPEGWWIRTEGKWFSKLFQDPLFRQKVKERWNNLEKVGVNKSSLLNFIDQQADALRYAQTRNFNVWNILSIQVWPNPVITGSYQGEVNYLKDWLNTRMDWMDEQFKNE